MKNCQVYFPCSRLDPKGQLFRLSFCDWNLNIVIHNTASSFVSRFASHPVLALLLLCLLNTAQAAGSVTPDTLPQAQAALQKITKQVADAGTASAQQLKYSRKKLPRFDQAPRTAYKRRNQRSKRWTESSPSSSPIPPRPRSPKPRQGRRPQINPRRRCRRLSPGRFGIFRAVKRACKSVSPPAS